GLLTLYLKSLNFRSSGQRAVSTVLSHNKTILKWCCTALAVSELQESIIDNQSQIVMIGYNN
ncbi:20523_t:CDS:1, partial [Racocetra persica]